MRVNFRVDGTPENVMVNIASIKFRGKGIAMAPVFYEIIHIETMVKLGEIWGGYYGKVWETTL